MKWIVFIIVAGVYLCSQSHVNGEPNLKRSVIEKAVKKAKAIVDSAYEYSRKESIARVKRKAASPADLLRLMKQPVGRTRNAVRAADYTNVAIDLLKDSLNKRQKRSLSAAEVISEEDLQVISDLTGCTGQRRPPSCKTTPNLNRFRTITGVCNNRKNTLFGASNTAFVRWLAAEYQDNFTIPRGWDPEVPFNNYPLPLVREVSNRILQTANDRIRNDPDFSFMLVLFAQWVDHDLTLAPHTPVIRSFNKGIDCDRTCDRTEPCFPIQIPQRDPRFGRNSGQCLPFFRSAPACGTGPSGHIFGGITIRQQINSLTAYIDASQVYGSDEQLAYNLRDLSSDEGLLKGNMEYDDNGRQFLPFSDVDVNLCATRASITVELDAKEVPCFLAGDERVSENIALTSLHTMFFREHNRLVRALAKLNPHWSGERLYQEARKIMGAYFQVLIFGKFLPIMLGQEAFDLELGSYPGYDENVDATIGNVFTNAFRFPHTMIQTIMLRLNEDFKPDERFPHVLLHKNFFAPWRPLYEGGVDPILRGLLSNHAKLNRQNQLMHDELRDRLFEFSFEKALDLGSLNMQRAREHGIPAYNKWRKFCNLSEPSDLNELAAVLGNRRLAQRLIDLYKTPDNIDLWLGGVAEPFVPGGRVGPLLACLVSKQFRMIRNGDRFWWENPGVFTEAQRQSLGNTSLARIICDNTGITKVPLKPFRHSDPSTFTNCNDVPAFDLSAWEDHYNSN
ncbi:eosinophil peroxidase-like [Brachionichthys hirsutus]|uniref:eosinophil peroxidase-like n=1 Tax=Brachionichthys hirsutus TaxID=412623 RepID=UPI0036045B1D